MQGLGCKVPYHRRAFKGSKLQVFKGLYRNRADRANGPWHRLLLRGYLRISLGFPDFPQM